MNRLICVIQARMASTRLPGKVLLPAPDDRPLLAVLLERVKQAKGIEEIVVATTTRPEDDAIGEVARQADVSVFRGYEADVLRRFVRVCDEWKADACVRLTGDNPLVDPDVITHCVRVFDEWGRKDSDFPRCDYVGTSQRFPEGMDVEVVSAEALGTAWTSTRPSDHEHVTLAVKRMVFTEPEKYLPTIWSGRYVEPEECGLPGDWGHVRVTVDEPADYAVVCSILDVFGPTCTMQEIALLSQQKPWLIAGNQDIVRNAGLAKSLEREAV